MRKDLADYKRYKEQAREAIKARIEFFSGLYKLTVNRIFVRNQRTRWGSCSKKGNLNFNFRLVYLPRELADYIIVHEICHLQEFNHSRQFWKLVEMTIPDYRELRKKLRTYRF